MGPDKPGPRLERNLVGVRRCACLRYSLACRMGLEK